MFSTAALGPDTGLVAVVRIGTAPTGVALTRYTLLGEDIVDVDRVDDDLEGGVRAGSAGAGGGAGTGVADQAEAVRAGETFWKQSKRQDSGGSPTHPAH